MKAEVEKLFHELADQPPEARERYFAEHGVDGSMRQEVEALLAFDSGASTYLLRDVSIAASRALPLLDAKGWRCGPYRLMEVVGRGGMGAVYRAERADGEVTQQVAVKLLPPGAADPQRERFLQERQILAALAHPNIARMMDAGHLDNGQPFLAMEYVDGKPIDVFAASLTVRQKIALFLKVCAAVAYLHRNLIVHRDLKPSNVLVTAEGEPKLLDFGIAKILDLATDATMTSMRMLTPDYASPEQASGGRISTATDVYSLGAVLYHLLTGNPPHEFEEKSFEAVALVIATREVTRPSKYATELKGDLEAILLRALRKDPQERYGTVEQFAEDLEAFLESRPVKARSGNTWYRTRKFVRRYWVPVAAAGLVIASLSGGLYVANRQRAIAQRRFQDVRQLANRLFDIDAQVTQLPGSAKTRQLIVDTSLEYLRRLRADVRGDPGLALDLAKAYMRVAQVEGLPGWGNLGQTANGERDLGIAEGLIHSVLRLQPSNRAALWLAVEAATDRMVVASFRGRHDEELALNRKTAEWLVRFNAGKNDAAEASAILGTYWTVALHFLGGQADEALKFCSRGADLALAFGNRHYRGAFLESSATIVWHRGNLEQALTQIREAVSLMEPASGTVDFREVMGFARALAHEGSILGNIWISLGRTEEAVAVLERAFQLEDDVVHRDPNDQLSRTYLFYSGSELGDMLRDSDPARALAVYDHTRSHLAEVSSMDYSPDVVLLAGASYALRRLGRPAEARRRLDAAFARLRELKLYPADKIWPGTIAPVEALFALAAHEAETGSVARAIEVYQELRSRLEAGGAKPESTFSDAVDLSKICQLMAGLYRRSGRADLALPLETQRLDLWRQWDRKLPNNAFVRRQIAAAARP
jgi:tetratricopeptide (TPR) repeat protein/predicted Ser/Thr protein kinase